MNLFLAIPACFDHAHASDRQLRQFHLEPRPSDRTVTGDVTVVRNDAMSVAAISAAGYDAIVLSPGP